MILFACYAKRTASVTNEDIEGVKLLYFMENLLMAIAFTFIACRKLKLFLANSCRWRLDHTKKQDLRSHFRS